MSISLPLISPATVTNTSSNLVSVSPWAHTTSAWNTATVTSSVNQQGLHVLGDASFEGDIKVKEKSLSDFMGKVEERLNILPLNEKLEAEWIELKTIGDKYRALEKELIEKNKMWNILKKKRRMVISTNGKRRFNSI